jgi:RNA polymerase sigma-70 factor (ECF subfamily)
VRFQSRLSAPLRLVSTAAAPALAYARRRVNDGPHDTDTSFVAAEALAHADALYAFAWRLARSDAQAEDLVQETFARCLAAQGRFERGTNLKAWLFRILRNAFIDQRRREQRNPVQAAADGGEGVPAATAAELERVQRSAARDIEAALHDLSEDQRSVVLLDLEGFSEQEIAAVMGCAQGTVKSRLARARAALRLRLREYAR